MKEKRKSSFAGYFVRQRRILYHVLSFYFFLAVEVALVVAAFVALLVFVVDLAVGLVTFAVRFDSMNYNVVYAQMGRGKMERNVAFA